MKKLPAQPPAPRGTALRWIRMSAWVLTTRLVLISIVIAMGALLLSEVLARKAAKRVAGG